MLSITCCHREQAALARTPFELRRGLAKGSVSKIKRPPEVPFRNLRRVKAGDGLEGLGNRSHRPAHSPQQMPAVVEAKVLGMRRAKPYWGLRRLALELARKGVERAPSESAVYRCLVRAAVIDPVKRYLRRET